jgi:hypothetical protein
MHAQLRTTVISFWRFPGSSRRSSTASECLQAAITPTVATNIQRQGKQESLHIDPGIHSVYRLTALGDSVSRPHCAGFAVVDKVFGDGLSKILLEEIKASTEGYLQLEVCRSKRSSIDIYHRRMCNEAS